MTASRPRIPSVRRAGWAVGAAALLVVAACAGGDKALSEWVQGTWECASVGTGGSALTSTITVGDGTFAFERGEASDDGEMLGYAPGQVDGTWTVGAGELRVIFAEGSDFAGYTSFTASGAPDMTGDAPESMTISMPWLGSDSDDANQVRVDIAGGSIEITHHDAYDGSLTTTTTCTRS